jgi:cytochrome P450
LLALGHRAARRLAPEYQREEFLLDQIPHWMFTFTNSGSDLLARSLAIIIARPACFARVLQEIDSFGSLNSHNNSDNLPYLEACIWETGRLFPPVVQTAHHARRTHAFDDIEIEAGTEIVQYFPFTNRDVSQDPLANHFRPERWLDPDDPIHSREFNIFLSGPRACPGKDIILFVVKHAIAVLMRNRHVQTQRSLLSDDPLPFSFVSNYFQA